MFFNALWKFLLVCLLLPVICAILVLSVYQFGSFWMPNWMRGQIARSIVWGRNEKLNKKATVIITASVILTILLWINDWLWIILIGGVVLALTWFFGRDV